MAKKKKKKKKKKTGTRRDATPGVPSATVRGGGGHAKGRVTGEKAASAVDPLTAAWLGDLDNFAKGLSASMKTACWFCWDFLETDNKWPLTKRAETRFTTRAANVAAEVRKLAKDFPTIQKECPEDALCRELIEPLDVGLPRLLIAIADELDRIAVRARQPMTAKQRHELLDDMQSLHRALEAALNVAEWIKDEVKAIKGHRPIGAGHAAGAVRKPLPPEIEALLVDSRQSAHNFQTYLGGYLKSRPRGDQSTIEFLGLLQEEQRRLDQETEHIVTTLQRFTASHREVAENGGYEELLRFLDEKEDVLSRLASRRRTGVDLLSGLIAVVKRRLSFDEDSPANDAVHRIRHGLGQYESCLNRQADLLDLLARQAADERAAAAVRESDLPEWDAIVDARRGDRSKLHGLDMLVAAFRDIGDDGSPAFVFAEKKELQARLNDLFPTGRPFSATWVDNHLRHAIAHQIVVRPTRPPNQSRRLADRFQVSDAAARKYGPRLPTS